MTTISASNARDATAVEHRRALEDLLATGHVSRRPVHSIDLGINGVLHVHDITDDSGATARALLKPVTKGGAQEVLAYQLARGMGVEQLLAATASRPDEAAAIEFVPGEMLRQRGVESTRSLESMVAKGLHKRHGLGRDDAAAAARLLRQQMQLFDVAIGNRDRHSGNALYDARSGRLALIDHGMMGSFKRRLVPYNSPYSGGADTHTIGRAGQRPIVELSLDPQLRTLAANADRAAMSAAFDTFLDTVQGHTNLGHNPAQINDRWMTRIFGTLDDAAAGAIRYVGRR